MFDEFDSIEDANTKIMMADTLKTLSDNVPNLSIFIIGIADSVIELIGEHPSLERCIKQINLPLMSREETAEIITRSLDILDLEMEDGVLDKIVDIASGFPHYIHLLSKYATRQAIFDDFGVVNPDHLHAAILESIENSSYSIRHSYGLAIEGTETSFGNLLYACAFVDEDEKNRIFTEQILQKYSEFSNTKSEYHAIQHHLQLLCTEERGGIFIELEPDCFQFRNPLMRAFIKLNHYQN